MAIASTAIIPKRKGEDQYAAALPFAPRGEYLVDIARGSVAKRVPMPCEEAEQGKAQVQLPQRVGRNLRKERYRRNRARASVGTVQGQERPAGCSGWIACAVCRSV